MRENINNNYFYKDFEFNATVFKRQNEIFLLAKDAFFYSHLAIALKTLSLNPKKQKKYSLLSPTKNLRNNISREIFAFESIIFNLKNEDELSDTLIFRIDKKEIIVSYTNKFIDIFEEEIKKLEWNNSYSEIGIEGIIFCPNWW